MTTMVERMAELERRMGAAAAATEIKQLWSALDGNVQEINQRLDAVEARLERPAAPTPDYSIEERLERAGFRDRGDGWHEPRRCSCEEALELRRQLAEIEATLAAESRVRLRLMNEADGLRAEIVKLQRANGAEREETNGLQARIAKALEALDATRWYPRGAIDGWQASPEGLNHARVMVALNALRGTQ